MQTELHFVDMALKGSTTTKSKFRNSCIGQFSQSPVNGSHRRRGLHKLTSKIAFPNSISAIFFPRQLERPVPKDSSQVFAYFSTVAASFSVHRSGLKVSASCPKRSSRLIIA